MTAPVQSGPACEHPRDRRSIKEFAAVERRQFLKMGALGVGATLAPSMARSASTTYRTMFDLTIVADRLHLIDGKSVFGIFFLDTDDSSPPMLRAMEGETIEVRIVNRDTRPHGFAITGVPDASIANIAPNSVGTKTFTAPVGGSYLFHDPIEAPLNRLLGLYGAFIVVPRLGTTPNNSPTPYSRDSQTREVRSLFDTLGTGDRFLGRKWDPADPARDKVWIFSQACPDLCERVERGEPVTGAACPDIFVPSYFLINGLSGYETADHDEEEDPEHAAARAIMIKGKQGQPTLIRTMNAGLATHSPHIHGNSVFDLTRQTGDTVTCSDNIFEVDAWSMRPLGRKDMLLPLEKPVDIPKAAWPPKQEPFPLRYVMHCHTEMSATAGGGNYPQGLTTHWEMTDYLRP